MKLSQKQIIIIAGGALLVIVLFWLIIYGWRQNAGSAAVTLKMWGVDSRQTMEDVLQGYKTLRPNVTVEYTTLAQNGYEDAVLNALAAGNGPDVFYVGNRELPKEIDKLFPVPVAQFDLVKLRSMFPGVVEQDFVSGGQIYALPLYLDSLAFFYNKDYFDQAGIVFPPKTWNEFQNIVPKLRVLNEAGQITRAAAAIGGSEKTVDSGVDLLELLMLQNGTQMTNSGNSFASFASQQEAGTPGLAAFNFYLQFANAGSPYYTWNDGQGNSLDSFAGGKTAMIFNYQSAVPVIKNKNPFLNFSVAPMPQAAGASTDINFAKYYGLAVPKQSKSPTWAWDLAIYLATDAGAQNKYLMAGGRPPALRTLISANLNDPNLSVFAKQALTARSWYQADYVKISGIFNSAIQNVLSGQADSKKALGQAQDRVSRLMGAR
jgi:multiple sugar transport system substrate-binding protein